MKAREVLEAIGLDDEQADFGRIGIEVSHGGDYVASGYMTDPDGRKWRVRVEALDG